MRNEKIFKVLFKFVNRKDKKVLKQKSYDYSCEVEIKNVKKTTKLRRTKLTFKKKFIVLLSRHLHIQENCIENEIIVFVS